MKLFLSIVCAAFLSSCAGIPLNESAQNVKLLTASPSLTELQNLEELGTLSCSKGVNFRAARVNIESCRNEIKNRAAVMGAEFVVLENQQLGTGGGRAGCPNCITLVGTAYRTKASPK